MKKQINDLLLKMQNGENCIDETANKLLDLYNVRHSTSRKGTGWYMIFITALAADAATSVALLLISLIG